MKILVAIPSKKRPENIIKYVLPFVNRLGIDYKIFIEPQDANLYNYANIELHNENDIGLGGALLSIKKFAIKNKYDAIFKIDDDVKGIGEVEKDMEKLTKALSIPNVAAICFPYKFEFYAKTEKLFTRVNKRIQTAYLIKVNSFRPSKDINTFEDFYQFLQIRLNGEDTLYCSKHLIDCAPVGSGKGGLQDFDRELMAKKEIALFRAIDSTISLIHKPDKAWKYEPKFNDKKYKSRAI